MIRKKVSRKALRWTMGVCLATCGLTTSCGDDDNRHEDEQAAEDEAADHAKKARGISPASGTPNGRPNYAAATMLFERKGDVTAEGLGLVFNRFRAYKSNPKNYSPTDQIDQISLEFWYNKPSDLDPDHYTRVESIFGGYMDVNDDGWLYSTAFPIGYVIPNYNGSSYLPGGVTAGIEVTAPDTLIVGNFEINTPAGVSSAIAEDANYPWGETKIRTGFEIADDTEYVRNTDLGTKTKAGCSVYVGDGSGSVSSIKYLWQDVELGHLTSMPQVDTTDDDEAPDAVDIGDDTVIVYDREWHITGIDLQTRKVRLFKKSIGYAYNRRALPSGAASGFEKLVQACNAAADASGGSFAIVYRNGAGTLQATNRLAYCAEFEQEVTDGDVNYNSYPTSCLGSNGSTWNTNIGYGTFAFQAADVTDGDIVELNFDEPAAAAEE